MLLTAVSVAGGWAGLAVGGVYSWASWVYSYNREAWMNDMQLRQTHDFQYDTLQIATHSMSREQVRDRTQAVITRLSNFILITTFVLSLVGEMFVEGQMPRDCANFILNVYGLCLGSTVFYLVLSAMFGVAACTVIYDLSSELLTDKVPPPWFHIDKNMNVRRSQESTRAFEHQSWRDMLMPPLLKGSHVAFSPMRFFDRFRKRGSWTSMGRVSHDHDAQQPDEPGTDASETFPSKGELVLSGRNRRSAQFSSDIEGEAPRLTPCACQDTSLEPKAAVQPVGKVDEPWTWRAPTIPRTALGATKHFFKLATGGALKKHDCDDGGALNQIEKDYEKEWAANEAEWEPLMNYSGVCAALGLKSLLEAYGYLCVAELFGENSSAWAFWAVQAVFICLNMLLVKFLCDPVDTWQVLFVAVGPLSCAVAATTPWKALDRVLVPLCYLCHMASSFWEGVDVKQLSKLQDSDDDSKMSGSEIRHHRSMRDLRATRTRALVADLLQSGLFVIRTLWIAAAIWAVVHACQPAGFKNETAPASFLNSLSGPSVADFTYVSMHWSRFFRPHALVCPRNQIFFADQFHVYEMDVVNRGVGPYPCDVPGIIADLTATCDDEGCWPIVLLRDDPRVFDCKSGKISPLLQTSTPAQQLAIYGEQTLVASHNGSVVRYEWSERRGGWSPLWPVANMGSQTQLQALDLREERLVIVSNKMIEMVDLSETGATCGAWLLPQAVVGAGCMVAGGIATLLLGPGREADPALSAGLGPPMRLMCAELEGPHNCARNHSGVGVSSERWCRNFADAGRLLSSP